MSVDKRPFMSGRLTLKQALLTLMIALVISLIAGSLELVGHASTMREEVKQRTSQQLAIVNGAAAEAASSKRALRSRWTHSGQLARSSSAP